MQHGILAGIWQWFLAQRAVLINLAANRRADGDEIQSLGARPQQGMGVDFKGGLERAVYGSPIRATGLVMVFTVSVFWFIVSMERSNPVRSDIRVTACVREIEIRLVVAWAQGGLTYQQNYKFCLGFRIRSHPCDGETLG